MRRVTWRRAVARRAGTLVLGLVMAAPLIALRASTALGQDEHPRSLNVEQVGHADLGGREHNAGVWAYRSFVYVGSSGPRNSNSPTACPGHGVAVVDLTDPTQPILVTSVAQRPGTTAEDVQALAVDSPAFRGDLLAAGIQSCSAEIAGGLSLWDVTYPRMPTELGFFEVGRGRLGVHEFTLFRRDGRAVGLLAVPFSETLDPEKQGDVRIVDLSDPSAPTQLSHWGAERALGVGPRQGIGRDQQSYAHSVEVSPDGRLAYVSYWDTGVVILDISDLRDPRYVGRTSFESDDEGNAHSVASAKGGRVLVEADEDLFVRGEALQVEGEPQLSQIEASYGAFRPVVQRAGAVKGSVVHVGRGCPATVTGGEPEDPYLSVPTGRVAIVDRGGCTFVEKVQRAQRNGALAVIIANSTPGLTVPDGNVDGIDIPAAVVRQDDAQRLATAIDQGRAPSVGFGIGQTKYDDWGALRFWDVSDPANPAEMATFATERARTDREKGPEEAGWFSVHHPVVLGDRLYAAWYSDGVRVLDIADPTRPREVGFFVPPTTVPGPGDGPRARPAPFVWSVFVRGDLILITDETSGLYVLRDLSR